MANHNLQAATRSRKYFLISVWLSWTVLGTLSYLRHCLEDNRTAWPTGNWPDYFLWLACFCPWAILTPLIFWLEDRFPFTRKGWKRNLTVLVLAGSGLSYFSIEFSSVLRFVIESAFRLPTEPIGMFPRFTQAEFYFELFFFWSILAAGCALRHFVLFHGEARQAAQLALEKSQLETTLRQAELEALRMRLNPHFLFNTLQNISVLAQQNPKLASQMLVRLGDVLRAALRRNASLETTVRDEIALTRDYLAVEQMRFGDRLTVLVDVAPGSDDALIPSFLLQPLAENAVIHGLRGISHAGTIAIRAARQDDRLLLTVADNGIGVTRNWPREGNVGIGLSSTRDRLGRMYPDQHEFVIQNLPEGGTEVRIFIPFRLHEQSDENVHDEQPATVNR
jgi:two-component sensor histidine kinase